MGAGLLTNILLTGRDVDQSTVAEGGRGGEVRELGHFLNRPDRIAKWVVRR